MNRLCHYITVIGGELKNFIIRNKVLFIIILSLFAIKFIWIAWADWNIGSTDSEKEDVLKRRNWLISKVCVEPRQLIKEMPSGIGLQFQGEWALYSCSMLTKVLTNMADLYLETKNDAIKTIDSLIQIVLSPELRRYDAVRWDEDPIESLKEGESHISYISHLAWMIGNYKKLTTDNKYDELHHSLCEAMNRRIIASPQFNLPTYPEEPIYIPDMLVAIVALHDYSIRNNGKYGDTVAKWLRLAKTEWLDLDTGLLNSTLEEPSTVKGSYSALNCYYLSLIDSDFAHEQYNKLKKLFYRDGLLAGLKEYHDSSPLLGFDIDAGPIVFGLSPSGTAFFIGSATYFNDTKTRSKLLRTAEIAGHTISWDNNRHYILADYAIVGEAITLAMRTNFNITNL